MAQLSPGSLILRLVVSSAILASLTVGCADSRNEREHIRTSINQKRGKAGKNSSGKKNREQTKKVDEESSTRSNDPVESAEGISSVLDKARGQDSRRIRFEEISKEYKLIEIVSHYEKRGGSDFEVVMTHRLAQSGVVGENDEKSFEYNDGFDGKEIVSVTAPIPLTIFKSANAQEWLRNKVIYSMETSDKTATYLVLHVGNATDILGSVANTAISETGIYEGEAEFNGEKVKTQVIVAERSDKRIAIELVMLSENETRIKTLILIYE